MSPPKIGHYTPQAFYTENQASMQGCLANTKNSTGCVDLSRASPVRQIFDQLLSGLENRHDYAASPNPELVTFYDGKNEITCDSRKLNSYDYVACRGRIVNDPHLNSFYNLNQVSHFEQGAGPAWHETLAHVGVDKVYAKTDENLFQGKGTPRLGNTFVTGILSEDYRLHGIHNLGPAIIVAIITITTVAAITLYSLYKVTSCIYKVTSTSHYLSRGKESSD